MLVVAIRLSLLASVLGMTLRELKCDSFTRSRLYCEPKCPTFLLSDSKGLESARVSSLRIDQTLISLASLREYSRLRVSSMTNCFIKFFVFRSAKYCPTAVRFSCTKES